MSDYRDLIAEEQGVELWDEIKEKCKYCEIEVDDRLYLMEIDCDYYTDKIYIDGNGNLTDDDCNSEKINYCPMCGRKL